MKYLQWRPRTFIKEMLSRIDTRGHSTRQRWGMDLLEKRGSASSGGSADDRRVHGEEGEMIMKYMQMRYIYGKCKAPER
jgi:hypothetical protein